MAVAFSDILSWPIGTPGYSEKAPAGRVGFLKTRLPAAQCILLLVILVIGGLFRLYWIDQPFVESHGWRESSTAMMAENIFHRWNVFYPEINWDGPGPSYNGREFQTVTLLAAVLYAFFGQMDWVGRLVGVVFGVWGIFALYKLICLIWDREHAIIGAAMMAVFPGSIFIDRQFLPDPALVALTTTGCWLFLAYLRSERPFHLALAVALSALAFLTKITGLSVAIAMVYAARSVGSSKPRSTITPRILTIAGLLTIAPVMLYYTWAWHLSRTYPPYHFAGEQGFIWSAGVSTWLHEQYYLPNLYSHLKNIWTRLGLVLVVVGLLLKPQHWVAADTTVPQASRSTGAEWFFHYWLLAAGGIYYLIGADHLVNQPYNFHLFDPPAAALAGHAIVTLGSQVKRYVGRYVSQVCVMIIVMVIAVSGYSTLKAWYQPISESGYKMGLALRQATKPGDLVVTFTDILGSPIAIYYSRRHGWVFPPAYTWQEITVDWEDVIQTEQAISWLRELRAKGARWVGIVRHQKDRIWRLNPDLAAYLQRDFELHKEQSEYSIYKAR